MFYYGKGLGGLLSICYQSCLKSQVPAQSTCWNNHIIAETAKIIMKNRPDEITIPSSDGDGLEDNCFKNCMNSIVEVIISMEEKSYMEGYNDGVDDAIQYYIKPLILVGLGVGSLYFFCHKIWPMIENVIADMIR